MQLDRLRSQIQLHDHPIAPKAQLQEAGLNPQTNRDRSDVAHLTISRFRRVSALTGPVWGSIRAFSDTLQEKVRPVPCPAVESHSGASLQPGLRPYSNAGTTFQLASRGIEFAGGGRLQ
jgi:hypothetical protein